MLTAYNQESGVGQAFRAANRLYVQENLRFVVQSALISPLPALAVRVSATLIVFIGGLMIIGRDLTVGQYVQFIVYLGLLTQGAQQIRGAFERLLQGSAAAARVGEVIHRWPRIANSPDAVDVPIRGAIRFENVGVWSDDQERWVLRNIDLEIGSGETVGIVGPTGAGKSMLLSLLGRIHDPSEGRILLDDHDLSNIKLSRLRREVVYVPQETLLFSMPLRGNIALGVPHIADWRIERAMEQSRLANDLSQLPSGLDSLVGERGSTLSGGTEATHGLGASVGAQSQGPFAGRRSGQHRHEDIGSDHR